MTSCPKCGSRTIIGPRYRINEAGGEVLLYTCAPCGYQMTTRTRDASPPVPDHLMKAADAKHRLFVHTPHNEDDLQHPDIDGDSE